MSKIHLYLPPEGIEVYKPAGMSIVFQGLIEMDAESSKKFFYDPIKRDGKEYGEFSVWHHHNAKPFQALIEEQRKKIFVGDMTTIPDRARKCINDFFGKFCTHHF